MKNFIIFNLAVLLFFCSCSKNDKVIAKIGKDKITLNMFQERLREASRKYQGYLDTPSGRREFLDILIRERIVMENAKRAGFDKRKDYKQSVKDYKELQARRLKAFQENLLMETYVNELHNKSIRSTKEEIEQYYKDNKNDFKNPKEITLSHILLATNQDAEKAIRRLKSGESFSKVAKDMSIDPVSAENGGEIGKFRKGDLVPELENIALKLRVGQISDIVKTRFGFHILKKTYEKTLPSISLTQAKDDISRMLEKLKFDTWLEQTKNDYNLKINYDLIDTIPPLNFPKMDMQDNKKPIESGQAQSDSEPAEE